MPEYTTIVLFRFSQSKKPIFDLNKALAYLGLLLFPLLLTQAQLLPLVETISESSRVVGFGKFDEVIGKNLFPLRRLITLLIPDFFGNPATGNFWEEISYFEYAIYTGVIPTLFALFSLFDTKNSLSRFWQLVLISAFVFMLETPIAKLPYLLELPGYSSLIPSRLISLVGVSLPILAALGAEGLLFNKYNNSLHKFLKINIAIILFLVFVFSYIILNPDSFIWPAKNHASYLTWKEGVAQPDVAATLRREFLVSLERADKLSGAWGRHPLLGRMYLPAYRAGTELVAQLRRSYPPEVILPALYGVNGVGFVYPPAAAGRRHLILPRVLRSALA